MTHPPQLPDLTTGDDTFYAYATALTNGDTPLLGHLVLYSIFDSDITPDQLQRWFTELALDPAFLPPPLRQVDAFERVTGPDGVRVSYPLDRPATATTSRGRRRRDSVGRSASPARMTTPRENSD